jgi:peptidyl-prolyl cis-trans isomerase B (cyclophilin B)
MAKWILPFAFLPVFCGCGGGSSEDAIIKQQVKLNQAAVEELPKVKDLAGIKQLLGDFAKNHQKIMNKIEDKAKSLSKEKFIEFAKRFDREIKPSQDQLDKALADFNKRMTKDKNYPQVLMETSMGTVKIELYDDLAPITVKNFLKYVDDKFFDGTTFHRVIPTFMIQGGGYEPGGERKTNKQPAIENESYNGLINNRGTLAMARTDEPNSATSEFFINVVDNGFLNKTQARDGYGYAVFGRVIDGMDVVDKIKDVETDRKDIPLKDVLIKSIRRVK